MKSEYRIAGISIRVDAPIELTDLESFGLYRVAAGSLPEEVDYEISLIPEEHFSLPEFDGKPVFQDIMHLVFQKEDQCLHLFHIPSTRGPSAWNWITQDNRIEIHYAAGAEGYYCNSLGCFNAAGFERILYACGKYLFHCSYVDDRGGAVLFSAPSGGGKTTQATLWEQYAGAEMINGDRAVLERTEAGYIAHGLPIAGSSGVFINRSLPIRAVFIVQKADHDSTVRLTQQEAFEAIFSQLTINTWNHPFVLSSVEFAMEMAANVPVFRLECRITPDAVYAAQEAIRSVESD